MKLFTGRRRKRSGRRRYWDDDDNYRGRRRYRDDDDRGNRRRGRAVREADLPIADYDDQTARDIADRLSSCSQYELRMIDSYERHHGDRVTVTDRIVQLTAREPWPEYDDQNVDEIRTQLSDADPELARRVLDYESDHKARVTVVDAAERRLASSTQEG